MRQDQNGYIVVETILCFLLFLFLNLSILSLINIVTLQARIHYALTQAAETISMYTYVLELTGTADHLVNNAQKAEEAEQKLNTFKTHIHDVVYAIESVDVSGTLDAGQVLYQDGVNVVNQVREDPQAVFQLFLNFGVQEGLDELFEQAVRPLVGRYLANGTRSGDEYLQAVHVVGGLQGLQFNNFDAFDLSKTDSDDSRFLTGKENVKLVVQYDIDYTFGILPLPFTKLHITQEAMTRAWLNGKGDGYPK